MMEGQCRRMGVGLTSKYSKAVMEITLWYGDQQYNKTEAGTWLVCSGNKEILEPKCTKKKLERWRTGYTEPLPYDSGVLGAHLCI